MTSKKPTKVFNPFEQLIEKKSSSQSVAQENKIELPPTLDKDNFTSMNFDKLNQAYGSQDQKELEKLREQLTPQELEEQQKVAFFKKYKREEEEYYLKRKQEEEEKKLKEEQEELEKKRLQEEERLSHQGEELPKGKVRKNIFGGNSKKADLNLPPEMKPGGGKQ